LRRSLSDGTASTEVESFRASNCLLVTTDICPTDADRPLNVRSGLVSGRGELAIVLRSSLCSMTRREPDAFANRCVLEDIPGGEDDLLGRLITMRISFLRAPRRDCDGSQRRTTACLIYLIRPRGRAKFGMHQDIKQSPAWEPWSVLTSEVWRDLASKEGAAPSDARVHWWIGDE
jgi:hypothetical protein